VDANSGPKRALGGHLEGGVDFKAVNVSPKDAEMIMSRKFNVEDICRWLGVPPILIGHAAEGQTMWGTGVEQIRLGWLMTGLLPYLSGSSKRQRSGS
jgi:phage portal protein BeeE